MYFLTLINKLIIIFNEITFIYEFLIYPAHLFNYLFPAPQSANLYLWRVRIYFIRWTHIYCAHE